MSRCFFSPFGPVGRNDDMISVKKAFFLELNGEGFFHQNQLQTLPFRKGFAGTPGCGFSIAMIRHDTFCPWFTSQLWNTLFFFGRLEFVPALVNVHSIQFPHQSPFQVLLHVHSWGRMSCYYQGTNPNENYLLFAGQCLPFIGRSSFHGLFWDTPGVPKRLRNRCLSSSPWVALVLTLRKLASACRSHWSLLLHFELFRFFLDEGPMIQNWVCRGPSNRRGGWGSLLQLGGFSVHPKWMDLLKWKGSYSKWPRSIL